MESTKALQQFSVFVFNLVKTRFAYHLLCAVEQRKAEVHSSQGAPRLERRSAATVGFHGQHHFIWWFPKIGVSPNHHKSSILMGFSLIVHPFGGTPILRHPLYTKKSPCFLFCTVLRRLTSIRSVFSVGIPGRSLTLRKGRAKVAGQAGAIPCISL